MLDVNNKDNLEGPEGGYMKALYFAENFSINLKLLEKQKSIMKMTNGPQSVSIKFKSIKKTYQLTIFILISIEKYKSFPVTQNNFFSFETLIRTVQIYITITININNFRF